MANTALQSTQAPYSVGHNGPEGTHVGIAATDKVGFYGVTPAVQYSTTGNVTGFVAGSGTASKSDSVWAGSTGTTAYTVGDIVEALKKIGILSA